MISTPRDLDRIVFTNGCFDVVHLGHIHLLKTARSLGERLIVGINSDASVKRLKGTDRPINNQFDRSEFLLQLGLADEVHIFEEDTPQNLIREIRPNILVKGSDYRGQQVVGAEFVEQIGGKVVLVELKSGYSTSNIVDAKRKNTIS